MALQQSSDNMWAGLNLPDLNNDDFSTLGLPPRSATDVPTWDAQQQQQQQQQLPPQQVQPPPPQATAMQPPTDPNLMPSPAASLAALSADPRLAGGGIQMSELPTLDSGMSFVPVISSSSSSSSSSPVQQQQWPSTATVAPVSSSVSSSSLPMASPLSSSSSSSSSSSGARSRAAKRSAVASKRGLDDSDGGGVDSQAVSSSVQVQPPPPPAWEQLNAQAHQLLVDMVAAHQQQEEQLGKLLAAQVQLVQTQTVATQAADLDALYAQLVQRLEHELAELHQVNRSVVLDGDNLHQTRQLASRLRLQQHHIDLLRRELEHYRAAAAAAPATTGGDVAAALNAAAKTLFAGLYIEEQPLPQVCFKGKGLDDNYVVRLLTGACADAQQFSAVTATLMADDPSWKAAATVENNTAQLDTFSRTAVFSSVKLGVSTRMTPVSLRFSVDAAGPVSGASHLVSELSLPLISITNESQWVDAAGKLVLCDAFAGQPEVSWPQFANAVHCHFLRCSRQDPARPKRVLSHADFALIHSRFFGNQPTLSQQQHQQAVSSFWEWFGHVTCTLRFKRHINSMWFTGLIYGLLSKEDCTRALLGQEEGTFLIRFSESFPGLFAVAYVSDDPNEVVMHYLVKPEDLSANKTLPDYLREKDFLKFVCQLNPTTGTIKLYPRDVVFQPYYAKRKVTTSATRTGGYVLL